MFGISSMLAVLENGEFPIAWVLLGGGLLLLLILMITLFKYGMLWLQAWLSNARVGLFSLPMMSLRKVNPKLIVNTRVMGVKAGIDISSDQLEASNPRSIFASLINLTRMNEFSTIFFNVETTLTFQR